MYVGIAYDVRSAPTIQTKLDLVSERTCQSCREIFIDILLIRLAVDSAKFLILYLLLCNM